MIRKTAEFFTAIMQRWLPDAFLFAIILTLVVFLAGILVEGESAMSMVDYWGDSLWNLLAFSMQMLLILVTGHVLAKTALISSTLRFFANLASSPAQAVILVTVVTGVASWLNWGFGLVIGGLIAREVGSRVRDAHFPLLVAAAYSGFILWHSGISGSIPLAISSPGDDVLGQLIGGQAIGFSETVFSLPILGIVAALLITLPIVNSMMLPVKNIIPFVIVEKPKEVGAPDARHTPAERLENSPLLSFLLGTMGLIYLFRYFLAGGGPGFNIVIFVFLVLGIFLHVNPVNYLNALADAIKGVGGIVLQYPLYAGIMGMMQLSGLATSISTWFVDISTTASFPVYTFLSAGVVNFFVPSGGGQWAVQGPIVIPAAEALGVATSKAAMAVALGDAWTNLIQPFWALPMLAIAGLKIRDIMGYCTVALLWSGLVIIAGILLFF